MAVNYQGGDEFLWGNAINATLNTFAKIEQTEAKRQQDQAEQRQKYSMKAQEGLAKINANGIRDVDAPLISEGYAKIKDLFFDLNKATTEAERIQRSIKFNEGVTQLQSNIDKSKYWKGIEAEGYKLQKDNLNYNPAKVDERVTAISSKPFSSLTDDMADFSGGLWGFSESKALSTLKQVDDSILNDLDKINVNVRNLDAGKQATVQTAKADLVVGAYNQLYDTNRDFKGYVDNMAEQTGLGIYETLGTIASQREQQGFLQKTTIGNKPTPRITNININSGSQNTPEASVVNNYALARNVNTGEVYSMDKYVQFNQPQTIAGLIQGLDPNTGNIDELDGTTDTKVVGVGHKDGKDYLVIDDLGTTLLIDKNKYLNKLSLTKGERTGLDKFDAEVKNLNKNSVSSQTPTKKKVTW